MINVVGEYKNTITGGGMGIEET